MQKLLNVGDVNLLLRCSHGGFWPSADLRYRGFVRSELTTPDETIQVDVVPDPPIQDHPSEDTEVRFVGDDIVEVARGNGIGTWNRTSRYCRIQQSEADYVPDVDYPDYVADSMIRVMLSLRLLENQGCLIHSAGLVRDGRGYLFVGKSGVGKSTVACLSAHEATILSDDCTMLRLNGDDATIHSTPFFSKIKCNANTSAPLHGIYFLRQATENALTALPASEAIPRLLQSMMFVGRDRDASNKILAVARAVFERIPCLMLDFVRDDSFWNLIHG